MGGEIWRQLKTAVKRGLSRELYNYKAMVQTVQTPKVLEAQFFVVQDFYGKQQIFWEDVFHFSGKMFSTKTMETTFP